MAFQAKWATTAAKKEPLGVGIGQPDCPLCDLGRGITAQVVQITPDLCREWTSDEGDVQRRMRRGHIHMIAADITDGRWLMNGQSFIFDRSSPRRILLDGRHRAHAIILADVAVESLLITGIDATTFYTMDQNTSRTREDALKAIGYDDARSLGSAAQLLWHYEQDQTLRPMSQIKLSPAASIDLVKEFPGLVDALERGKSGKKICRAVAVPVFVNYTLAAIDEGDTSLFFHRLISGEELKAGDPILALRNRLINERFSVRDQVFLMFKAWNMLRQGKSCTRLQIKPNEGWPEPV